MTRPSSGAVLELLRPLAGCRHTALARGTTLARPVVLARPAPSLRPLSTSPSSLLFSRKSEPSAAVPTEAPAAVVPSDIDAPLTPFQEKIAALETETLNHPGSISTHLGLLKALLEGGEYGGLTRYYETIALNPDVSASGREAQEARDVLVKSDEAWTVYLEALSKSGRLGEIATMVRRRDDIVKSLSSSATPSSPSVTGTGSSIPTAALSTGAAATSTSTTAAPRPSILSSLGSSQPPSPPTPSAQPAAAASSSGAGTPLSPIYVQLAPATPQASAWKAVRWMLGALLWAFIIMTILSMVMENTGLLKAGQGPAEFEPEEGKIVKFSDVHGVEEAKNELEEIVEFLKNPEKFSTLGGKLPKGVLLTGPPGTGKTMLARAVAGEAEVPFLFASGSSFEEMFVGVGAKRVRELFAAARKKAPAIVFIDELDAIGSKRSAKDQHYMKQTLNQLLVELDGFTQSEGVIIIAATNFPESLDKALTRPGRFDRHVVVGLPDVRGRIEILKHHMADVHADVEVDPSIIARGCPGMSGADLQNLVNQAAVKASREGSTSVKLKHFEWAKDRILMGAERKSHFVTEESKKATAYHEGGHALVAMHTPGAMPLHKVTIMPRGQALGITFQLPEQDKDSYTRREYSAMIDVALGGRAAEEMVYGKDETTSGCSSDLMRATDVATRMIRNYGFSEKVGLVAHGDEESVYLSSKKKDEIEGEIRSFLDDSMKRAVKVLKDNEDQLHKLAKALVEYETLNLDEVKLVLDGKPLDRLPNIGEALKGEQEKKGEVGQVIVDGI
ncbi:ATP-dependent peptidase [Papiliotrema laurentii]|uniref:ATP-dependent peptidase n=1 Tax=Papiliotrema laurentii TaxID=5418 RepID=A0AAD9D1M9_PAPLA|nr:ATP-dependent peptidase [Papiliotrema laurentii]